MVEPHRGWRSCLVLMTSPTACRTFGETVTTGTARGRGAGCRQGAASMSLIAKVRVSPNARDWKLAEVHGGPRSRAGRSRGSGSRRSRELQAAEKGR
eukprot:16441831-Heterocapsa_arctica.AAC.2